MHHSVLAALVVIFAHTTFQQSLYKVCEQVPL